jgi:hypothetical protein
VFIDIQVGDNNYLFADTLYYASDHRCPLSSVSRTSFSGGITYGLEQINHMRQHS